MWTKSITPVESIQVMDNGQPPGDVNRHGRSQRLDFGASEGEVHARPDPPALSVRRNDARMDHGGRKPVRSKAYGEYFVQWIDSTLERAMKLSFNNEMERN